MAEIDAHAWKGGAALARHNRGTRVFADNRAVRAEKTSVILGFVSLFADCAAVLPPPLRAAAETQRVPIKTR